MSEPILEVDGVDFSYGAVQVLFGTTLSIEEGEILALLGPNGAGKTTLLRVISGLEHQQRGTVRFLGQDLGAIPAEERARRGLVTVFGGQAVFGDLGVEANLRAGGQLLRSRPGLLETRTREVYDMFPRLLERRRSLAVQLSGGEQQMLALGKAFLLRPRLLSIDELSMGLAPMLVNRLLDVLREFRDAGITILLVEQSANVAAAVADRAAVLERGEVRHVGAARDVASSEVLHELLIRGARA